MKANWYTLRGHVGRLRVTYEYRSNDLMGRFGGGWNWKLGLQVGAGTIILNLLIATLRFDWEARRANP